MWRPAPILLCELFGEPTRRRRRCEGVMLIRREIPEGVMLIRKGPARTLNGCGRAPRVAAVSTDTRRRKLFPRRPTEKPVSIGGRKPKIFPSVSKRLPSSAFGGGSSVAAPCQVSVGGSKENSAPTFALAFVAARFLCQPMAKLNSGGARGSTDAVSSDENPHRVTGETGAPDPHCPPSACREIVLERGPGVVGRGEFRRASPKTDGGKRGA